MTSYERWVRRTRESVMRAIERHGVAVNVEMLYENLDITEYMPSLGFVDRRTRGEVRAALRWLESQGYIKKATEAYPGEFKDLDMPKGQLYEMTEEGIPYLDAVSGVFATQRHDR